MVEIEPDLVRATIPLLDEIYALETPEQRKKRGEHYVAAFEECARRFTVGMGAWKLAMDDYRKQALASVRQKSAEQDKQELSSIEHQISDV